MDPFTTVKQLTLAGAKQAGAAAEAEALRNGWQISVVIVDHSGTPIYAARMTDAILASYDGALKKAVTALKFARPTKAIEDNVMKGKLHYLAFDYALPVEGGLPIVVDDRVIGGIGIGGGPSGKEAVRCAIAGLKELGSA